MKSLLLLTVSLPSFAASPVPISESTSRINQRFRAVSAALQYPHAIEHDGLLRSALSRLKTQSEVFRVSRNDIAAVLKK